MQTRNRFFDDIAKVANSAAGGISSLKDEMERMIRHRVEMFITDMNLVTSDELDALKSLVSKSREEIESLQNKLAILEKKLSEPNTKRIRKKKAVVKKIAAKK